MLAADYRICGNFILFDQCEISLGDDLPVCHHIHAELNTKKGGKVSEIRARVQFFSRHEMLPTEIHKPYQDTGEAMAIAHSLGGTALEIADVRLLQNPQWRQAMRAEGLPTMFDL